MVKYRTPPPGPTRRPAGRPAGCPGTSARQEGEGAPRDVPRGVPGRPAGRRVFFFFYGQTVDSFLFLPRLPLPLLLLLRLVYAVSDRSIERPSIPALSFNRNCHCRALIDFKRFASQPITDVAAEQVKTTHSTFSPLFSFASFPFSLSLRHFRCRSYF